MDTNNNGEVDKSEVRKFMHIFCDLDSDEEVDSETVESNAQQFMEFFDANADGKITFDEWKNGMLKAAAN